MARSQIKNLKSKIPQVLPIHRSADFRIHLRHATDLDSPAVVALIRRCLREYRLRFDPETIDRPLFTLEAHYRRPGRRFWVLEEGGRFDGAHRGRIIGTVAIDRRSRATAELAKMYVERRCRGRGFGRRLLRVALAFARRAGYRRVMLETNTRFRVAAALYAKAGFRLRRRVRIPPRCDAVYMLDL